jgi:hypothetical protein
VCVAWGLIIISLIVGAIDEFLERRHPLADSPDSSGGGGGHSLGHLGSIDADLPRRGKLRRARERGRASLVRVLRDCITALTEDAPQPQRLVLTMWPGPPSVHVPGWALDRDERGRDANVDVLQAAEYLLAEIGGARARTVQVLRQMGMTWAELGERLHITRHQAWSEFVDQVPASLVSDREKLPPPLNPITGSSIHDWCRWCGQRVVLVEIDGGWRHTDGPASSEPVHAVDAEPHEPWPPEED